MNEQNDNSLNVFSFGFSENDNFLNSTRQPHENSSPIGSYPGANSSPIGSYPDANSSPIGSYPDTNSSPIGSYPDTNSSPIGSWQSRDYNRTEEYQVNNFNQDNSYNIADNYPPYQRTEQNGFQSYNDQEQNGYYNGYDNRPNTGTGYDNTSVSNANNDISIPGTRALGAMPKNAVYFFSGWVTLTMILTLILFFRGEKWSIIFELFQLIPLVSGFAAASYKNKLRAAFICMGISAAYMAITAVMRINMPKAFDYYSRHLTPNFMLMIFFLAGVLMMTVPSMGYNRRLRRCTERVRALIVDVQKQSHRSSKGHRVTTYCPTFEFTFRGQKYTASERVYTNSYKPVKGRHAEIMFDPNDPTYITDIEMHTSSIIMLRIFGVLFSLMTVFAFYIQMLNG